MAFAVDVFANTRPIGKSISRLRRSFNFLSGATLVGASFAASAWIVTTIAAMHVAAPSTPVRSLTDITLAPKVAAVAPAKQRLVHVTKFSRLGMLTAEKAPSPSKNGRVLAPSALMTAFIGTSAPVAVAEAAPPHAATVVASAAPAQQKTKDDSLPVVRTATNVVASNDRIVIPSKEEVAAIEGPALLALASAPRATTAPNSGPTKTADIEVASVAPDTEMKDAAQDNATQPFDLVLSDRDASIPLPMARPDGLKRAPAADHASRPAEPVLAYARPDVGDDEGQIPMVPKRSNAVARNGVAVYDISANTVYLPSGERLEAHSGLGKMRDNPRFVHEKNRGPTPPHTYQLTMRESLFHGVEAIRLNPVGGAGNVYNRVGLLAHTYMLGARGDSNGCVSFKDYRRFLAAFKRGDIRQLVVVTSMQSKPSSTLASLFSSRS
ncbi:hypothetical protein A6U87_17640 [Rhizobium sp. AC44/96]|uniref:DUF2778 domain-containing protein n=1 Tax=Rhizobium sp. AC44/96 TaxID=1841654 RepID=UPI00080FB76A|nr:DUF2778 domain-containing protein [Rhizobium sp. AC44/96]OCJ03756.1 hypothetical protein A6U87_17640 [Rhizobium sp. AC44/96]